MNAKAHAQAHTYIHIQHPLMYPELLRARNSATGTKRYICQAAVAAANSDDIVRFWQRDTPNRSNVEEMAKYEIIDECSIYFG